MKISVITVVFNAEDTIEQTLKSVISQNYHNLEYIVIDGCSTDGTLDIIKRYESYVTCWVSEPDNGVYDAMNKGIRKATGDVVAFLNSGDWYEQNVLDAVNDAFTNSNTSLVYGFSNLIRDNKITGKVGITITNPKFDDIHVVNLYCHQSLFIKRTLFDCVGMFDLQYPVLADYAWNLKAHNMGFDPIIVPQIWCNYRGGGISDIGDIASEQKRVSLDGLNGHYEYLNRIESRFDEYRYKPYFLQLMDRNIKKFREYLDNSNYYIWGTGDDSETCFAIFFANKIKVKAFIDSYNRKKEYHNLPVCYPEEVHVEIDEKVFISSARYEEEIKKQVLELGICENQIVTFTDLWKYAYSVLSE